MNFSQRIGEKPAFKEIQLHQIDSELRITLWNIVKMSYLDFLDKAKHSRMSIFRAFAFTTWFNFYKLPVDQISIYDSDIEKFIRHRFFNDKWFEIYDFIEFIINIDFNEDIKTEFIKTLNNALEKEFSGYRIINNIVAPISNQIELEEVANSISNTNNLTALEGVNIHMNSALEFISDKKNPNYRNSIKESISAVESTCRVITGESTLGKALDKFETKGLIINNQLQAGFEKIYAYTNDKDTGIRHAIVEQANEPDFEDAKYMLVSCSSFINYLIGKAEKIGLKY
ncbi:MAG: hypothetical protein WCT77_12225 [Bacteroidota bacterium]